MMPRIPSGRFCAKGNETKMRTKDEDETTKTKWADEGRKEGKKKNVKRRRESASACGFEREGPGGRGRVEWAERGEATNHRKQSVRDLGVTVDLTDLEDLMSWRRKVKEKSDSRIEGRGEARKRRRKERGNEPTAVGKLLSVYHLFSHATPNQNQAQVSSPSRLQTLSPSTTNSPIVVSSQPGRGIQTLLQISLVGVGLEQFLPGFRRELGIETSLVGVLGFLLVM